MSTTSNKIPKPCRQNKPKRETGSKPLAQNSTSRKLRLPKLGASACLPSKNGNKVNASREGLPSRLSKPFSKKQASSARALSTARPEPVNIVTQEIEFGPKLLALVRRIGRLAGVSEQDAFNVMIASALHRVKDASIAVFITEANLQQAKVIADVIGESIESYVNRHLADHFEDVFSRQAIGEIEVCAGVAPGCVSSQASGDYDRLVVVWGSRAGWHCHAQNSGWIQGQVGTRFTVSGVL